MSEQSFYDYGFKDDVVVALSKQGIVTPTPIQAKTLPDSLGGKDILGCGRTGSGKTFAFLLPLVSRIMNERFRPTPGSPRTLVLAPTRELVSQINESLGVLKPVAKVTSQTVFGGVGQGPQVKAAMKGLDIAIATPGRLEDLVKQGEYDLSEIEAVVIDEADQMADMGFLPVVRRILDRVPKDAQVMLFSATLDGDVKVLVDNYLKDPVQHMADDPNTASVSDMNHYALHVSHEQRPDVIANLCATDDKVIVFCRTKYGSKNLARKLTKMGVPALELHGDMAQGARMRNMEAFHKGKVTTLVATDIAARGIHVDDVELVIHADPPAEHKAYLHRSGRTARAGAKGNVVTLVRPDQIRDVKRLMKKAQVNATWEEVTPKHPLLAELIEGKRKFLSREESEQAIRDLIPGSKNRPRKQNSSNRNRKPYPKKGDDKNGDKNQNKKRNFRNKNTNKPRSSDGGSNPNKGSANKNRNRPNKNNRRRTPKN